MKRQFERQTKAGFSGVHHHFCLLTGDYEKAILLDALLYQAKFGETAMEHLQEQVEHGSLACDNLQWEEMFGWVVKSITWYLHKYLPLSSQPTVSRKLNEMVVSGLIEVRDSAKTGVPVGYRPRMTELKKRLAELGYTLDGSIIRELVDGVEEHFANPPKPDHERTSGEQWDAIPGAPPPVKKPKTTGEKNERTSELTWIAKCKLLAYAPPNIQHFSWLVYKETGHTPDQHKKTWIADLETLNKAAGGDERILLSGLHAGEMAKRTGMVLKGPRSYLGYVQSARASANKPASGGEPVVIGQSPTKGRVAVTVGTKRKATTS